MPCAICQKRRPRRYCPGVTGEICPECCGVQREVTVRCPSDCEYLREARKHERTAGLNPATIPHREISITEEFLEDYSDLISFLSGALAFEAVRNASADCDAREALASLVKTYQTLQKGVIYESLPANPLAAALHRAVQQAAAGFLADEQKELGMPKTRDADILRALVFLEVLSIDRDNGRAFGRSFLDALAAFQPPAANAAGKDAGSSLILP
jgi:hypothetical protein